MSVHVKVDPLIAVQRYNTFDQFIEVAILPSNCSSGRPLEFLILRPKLATQGAACVMPVIVIRYDKFVFDEGCRKSPP